MSDDALMDSIRRDNEPFISTAPQHSATWFFDRVGHCTASRFDAIIAKTKAGKPTAEREKYLWEVVVERITQQPQDHFSNTAMQWGEDKEPGSRMDHEAQTGEIIEQVGFIKHPTLKWVGGSPDGLIGEDGGWESKSPYNSAVHLQTILRGMPEEHMAQVQGLMWITGRKWWWFKSYDPRLPEPLCRYTKRIERDEQYISHLAAQVMEFAAEVEARVKEIQDAAAA